MKNERDVRRLLKQLECLTTRKVYLELDDIFCEFDHGLFCVVRRSALSPGEDTSDTQALFSKLTRVGSRCSGNIYGNTRYITNTELRELSRRVQSVCDVLKAQYVQAVSLIAPEISLKMLDAPLDSVPDLCRQAVMQVLDRTQKRFSYTIRKYDRFNVSLRLAWKHGVVFLLNMGHDTAGVTSEFYPHEWNSVTLMMIEELFADVPGYLRWVQIHIDGLASLRESLRASSDRFGYSQDSQEE